MNNKWIQPSNECRDLSFLLLLRLVGQSRPIHYWGLGNVVQFKIGERVSVCCAWDVYYVRGNVLMLVLFVWQGEGEGKGGKPEVEALVEEEEEEKEEKEKMKTNQDNENAKNDFCWKKYSPLLL